MKDFNNDEDLYRYLEENLKKWDLIDLLEKLSCLRFFVQTSFLKCAENERKKLKHLADESFSFLFSFLLCHHIESSNVKISYLELYDLVDTICSYLFEIRINSKNDLPQNGDKIDYIQNNLTDLIGNFKRIPTYDILSCQNDMLEAKYNVSAEELCEELIDIFPKKIYCPKNTASSITPEQFINEFEQYIDTNQFIIDKDQKSYSLCSDLSASLGEFGFDNFKITNPLSVINLKRKLFIKHKGKIYNLCDDLICGRLNRSIESLFNLYEEKDKWRINYKERTEHLPKILFESFLPGGQFFENSYYRSTEGKLCESDGLYVFHNFIFCIEVKGNKFNPDPIKENDENVENSYNEVTNKAKSQTLRIKDAIESNESFSILDSSGKTIEKLENLKSKKIIGICLYYEDIGTLVSGISEDNEILHISYYDLLLVFKFLENPFLICKYLLERISNLKEKRYYINDELVFLSLFRKCIHLNAMLNSQNIPKDENIGNIYFPNEDFGMEIEIYILTGQSKPEIQINDFISRLITFKDFSSLDDCLFNDLFYLLCQSQEDWNNIEEKFKLKNNSKERLPICIAFMSRENQKHGHAIMLLSRGHNPYQKKQSLAFAKTYLNSNSDIDFIYLIEIGKDYLEFKKLRRGDYCLNEINEKELLSDNKFFIKRSSKVH